MSEIDEFLKAAQEEIFRVVQANYHGRAKHKAGKISLCNDKLNKNTDLNHKLRTKLNVDEIKSDSYATEAEGKKSKSDN